MFYLSRSDGSSLDLCFILSYLDHNGDCLVIWVVTFLRRFGRGVIGFCTSSSSSSSSSPFNQSYPLNEKRPLWNWSFNFNFRMKNGSEKIWGERGLDLGVLFILDVEI